MIIVILGIITSLFYKDTVEIFLTDKNGIEKNKDLGNIDV